MPSILAFFEDPQVAYNCLNDIRKIAPSQSKVYTVAREEYSHETKGGPTEFEPTKFNIATNIGGIMGTVFGLILAYSVLNSAFKSISHALSIVFIVLACAAAGSSIGFVVLLYTRKKKQQVYSPERKKLILIVESPGEKKEDMVSIIEKYNPSKLKTY